MRCMGDRHSQGGFSLIEVMVAGLVLVVGLILMAQFFGSATARVLDSDVRSVLDQVAAEEIEMVRGLPYEDVGTTDGHPEGILESQQERTVNKVRVQVDRAVIFWTDSSYTGPYPANYRRVTVRVTALDYPRLGAVELSTNVAGGVPGGTLDITVTDMQGAPVPDAAIEITNTHLVPNVNISSFALRTDSAGHMLVPGLVPDDTPNYVVTVSKSGYNTAYTEPAVVVQDGLPYTVVQLIIDRLATLKVKVVDSEDAAVEGLRVLVTGPWHFEEEITSTSDWYTFADMAFSTSTDAYVVMLQPGQGYDPISTEVVLDPGATQEVVLTVPTGGGTTTTTSGSTTTTGGGTTTTTASQEISLTVRVVNSRNGNPINRAWVTLGSDSKRTNSQGDVVFGPLEVGSYSILVRKNRFYDYTDQIQIDGSMLIEVRLVRI